MIEQALRALFTGDAGLAALLDKRVYPERLPQNPRYPALTAAIVAGQSTYSMDGASGLANPRIQVDCYAETKDGVIALRDKVMAALSGYRGSAGAPAVEIYGAFRVSEIDAPGSELNGAGPRVWRKTLDFIVWHKESY